MKIRLFLAIAIILFSITSGVEILGMQEFINENKNTDSYSNSTSKIDIFNLDLNNNKNNEIHDNGIKEYSVIIHNIGKHYYGNPIFINKPFGKNKGKNELFSHLYKMVGNIYWRSLWFTFFEFCTSFGISILNNIFGFEKMVKNKFYANMLLLRFGFKLAIPFLSFIIVDFNICIYNWVSSYMKYVIIYYHKTPLNSFGIECEADCIKNNLKFIYLFNVFNIDIKLSLFGLSLCFPITKILEALLITKGIQEINKNEDYQKLVSSGNIIKNKFYESIYEKVAENSSCENISNGIKKIGQRYKDMMDYVDGISMAAKEIFMPTNNDINDNNNNNNNNNENSNNENNNNENNNENIISINSNENINSGKKEEKIDGN